MSIKGLDKDAHSKCRFKFKGTVKVDRATWPDRYCTAIGGNSCHV